MKNTPIIALSFELTRTHTRPFITHNRFQLSKSHSTDTKIQSQKPKLKQTQPDIRQNVALSRRSPRQDKGCVSGALSNVRASGGYRPNGRRPRRYYAILMSVGVSGLMYRY